MTGVSLLAHQHLCHVTVLQLPLPLSQYGNFPLAKIRGPSAEASANITSSTEGVSGHFLHEIHEDWSRDKKKIQLTFRNLKIKLEGFVHNLLFVAQSCCSLMFCLLPGSCALILIFTPRLSSTRSVSDTRSHL